MRGVRPTNAGMSYLLFPDDERRFVTYLIKGLGAVMLRDEHSTGGNPHLHADPTAAVGSTLPGEGELRTLIFWLQDVGPVATLRDAPDATDVKDRVAVQLTKEAAGSNFGRLVDLRRTPVVRWHRSVLRTARLVVPGMLQAMVLAGSAMPPEVSRRHRAAERWLKSNGVAMDPFAHCQQIPVHVPADRRHFRVWAHPVAAAWVA